MLRKFWGKKHFFKGQSITTLPKVNKGCGNFKGKSCKVKVDNVLQNMSKKNWSTIFSKFGPITVVDFILLDPDTLERENFCFSEFVCCQKATSGEQHKVVKNTSERIVCSLPHDITVDDLRDYFEQFGAVELID